MATEDDGKIYATYLWNTVRSLAESSSVYGDALINQNLTEYQKVETTIARLTQQIDYNQTLVQRYLNKAITDVGVNSKSSQLLLDTAKQQAQVVDWLKNLKSDDITRALSLNTNVLDGPQLKIAGAGLGTAMDSYGVLASLYEKDYAGSLNAGVGMFSGTLITSALVVGAAMAGITITPIIALGIGVSSVLGSNKLAEWSAKYGLHDVLVALISNPKYELAELGSWISEKVWNHFNDAQNWRPYVPVDPLALDLDNDGIETTAINGWNGVLFDHNNDGGVKTATGWLKGDDGFLVLDRNGNGTIDNGGELFGDNTKLGNGVNATDGFAALADVDTNYDHIIDVNDGIFPLLKVWQDLNQDGISQANDIKFSRCFL